MATEAERYLQKARESLESAEADAEAGRNNSAANRAYYAAFQASVAALVSQGVKPSRENWEHRYVQAQVGGKLAYRRKVLSSGFAAGLEDLFEWRVLADYQRDDISARRARRAVRVARLMVDEVVVLLARTELKESPIHYGEEMVTKLKDPRQCVDELLQLIRSKFPDIEVEVFQRAERDFTVHIRGDFPEDGLEVTEVYSMPRSRLLVDHDVWVVILVMQRSDRDN